MYYRLNGLVLQTKISSEADKQLTIYTNKWGKIVATAPGAKKITAKLSSATEPLTESEFMIYLTTPNSRAKITGAKILDNFSEIKNDWRKLTIAQCCIEICDKLTPFRSENKLKYELLCKTLKYLEQVKNPWRIFIAFTLRFLKLSGYSFTEYLKKENFNMNSKERDTIKRLATLSGKDIDKMRNFEEESQNRIMKYLNNYLNFYLPRPLATIKFLQKVNRRNIYDLSGNYFNA
ncbi:MAG: DNA repair protein RecO [Endomicrobiales bacterium]|nr:DNA repair protein RecO [Endomicrobiales bacterium]